MPIVPSLTHRPLPPPLLVPLTGLPHTPLESLRARWQSAAEALCAQHGLNPSLLGVVVSEVVDTEGELPAGVQHFKQVQDWVVTNAGQAHRMV